MLEVNYHSLSNFCDAFQCITHIKQIVIYNADGKPLFGSYPDEKGCPFYEIFKDIPALNKKCLNSDLKIFNQQQYNQNNMYYAFTCPFGLTKVIVPIYDKGLIGYIKFSRFILDTNKDKTNYYIKNIAKEYGVNEQTLSDIYRNIEILDYKKIKDMALITTTCLSSLMQKKVLYYKDTQLNEYLDSYINQNINNDLSTKKICEYLHISKSTLYKISLNYYNESINKHIEKLRLEYAKKLLCEENYQLNIVAEKCGIPDANYFSKKFKKQFGMSPSEFIKNTKKK